MEPVTEQARIDLYLTLVREMTIEHKPEQFSPEWIRRHAWKVVPVEDTMHFADTEISRIVSVLNPAGSAQCVAVATQQISFLPTCYRLFVSDEDLRKFNSECGPFRYLLTDEGKTWAISCTEWYNLFAGDPAILEAMLGESIDEARRDFVAYATLLATGQNPDESILQVARHYAAL